MNNAERSAGSGSHPSPAAVIGMAAVLCGLVGGLVVPSMAHGIICGLAGGFLVGMLAYAFGYPGPTELGED